MEVGSIVQAGAVGLCICLIGVLSLVVKKLLSIVTDDLTDIKKKLDTLPCRSLGTCPPEISK